MLNTRGRMNATDAGRFFYHVTLVGVRVSRGAKKGQFPGARFRMPAVCRPP